MALTFPILCQELATLQVQLLRREGAPKALASEALSLLREHSYSLRPSPENSTFVPVFLRSCASLLKHVTEKDELGAIEALDDCFDVSKFYIGGNGNQRNNVNESAAVLRSVLDINDCYNTFIQKHNSNHAREKLGLFSELVVPSYDTCINQLRSNADSTTILSILTLLRGTSAVYGSQFKFSSSTADKVALLPIKSKIQMEAKIQRCFGARDLLNRLYSREFNRLDAGMCLSTMADTGFYDGDICNLCCSSLHTSYALLSSSQICQILYSLGVLQHRHIHQKFFSSLVNAKQCTSDCVQKHVLGLAMLRQPPPDETKLMNGIFLHALRHSRGSNSSSATPKQHLRYDESLPDSYQLPPLWYIRVGHGLSVLDITHYKYKLMVAREARRSIGSLSTREKCELLYALGGVKDSDVPQSLQHSWAKKVKRTIEITSDKLEEDIHPKDGPFVMNALLFCGVKEHGRIPKVRTRSAEENPVDLLLKTWANSPKEKVLQLAEKMDASHFSTDAPQKLSSVVSTMANSFGNPLEKEEQYRLGSLCAVVEEHAPSMNIGETLQVLDGLTQIGVRYESGPVASLLEQLWSNRHKMSNMEKERCAQIVGRMDDTKVGADLLGFVSR